MVDRRRTYLNEQRNEGVIMKIQLDFVVERVTRRRREHIRAQDFLNNIEWSQYGVLFVGLRAAKHGG